MNVIFLREANQEFLAAVAYYESRQPGLGQRFEEEVDRAVHWLVHNPQACALRRGLYRRLNLHIFPYYIAYVIRSSTLWIVAIAHARRRPEYWINRAIEQ
jgi:plasmid stabilization system protein ParE